MKEEDFKRLDNPRPFGISGHLRVKNEEGPLRACVLSVIDFLDELIITYQKSEDKTQQIIEELVKEYPDKIRVYFYAPYVFPYGSKENDNTQSIHNLANYYNYGYVKIKYAYYVKIDADQIYIKEKMQQLRDLVRKYQFRARPSKVKIDTFIDKVQRKIIRHLFVLLPSIWAKFLLAKWANRTVGISLGGINASLKKQRLCMPIKTKELPPFCGILGDHMLWAPHSDHRYYWEKSTYVEHMPWNGITWPVGFFWVHLGPLKRGIRLDDYQEDQVLDLALAAKTTKKELVHKYRILKVMNLAKWRPPRHIQTFKKFWDQDRKYLKADFVELCYKISRYYLGEKHAN